MFIEELGCFEPSNFSTRWSKQHTGDGSHLVHAQGIVVDVGAFHSLKHVGARHSVLGVEYQEAAFVSALPVQHNIRAAFARNGPKFLRRILTAAEGAL